LQIFPVQFWQSARFRDAAHAGAGQPQRYNESEFNSFSNPSTPPTETALSKPRQRVAPCFVCPNRVSRAGDFRPFPRQVVREVDPVGGHGAGGPLLLLGDLRQFPPGEIRLDFQKNE
jgi:hypothetical protein